MKREAAIVRDADGNELYFAETQGECESWCTVNNITGENGEYIAIGTFDEESRYFEAEDYAEINGLNMYNDYVLILYELMTHKVECRFRYEEDCQALGEDHEITKYRLQLFKDTEKAIELFEKIIAREDQQ